MTVDHIKDLRVFVQVVDSRNLTAAGRILGLAPAVVSRCLARLERSLGVRPDSAYDAQSEHYR